jgi:minor capsid protein
MSILEFAGAHLQARLSGALVSQTTLGVGFVQGVNLFLGRFVDRPDVAICVYEYEGMGPVETMGTAPFALSMPRIQIVTRAGSEDYPVARDLALLVRRTLASVTEQSLGGLRVLRIASTGSVLPMGEDEHNRPRFSANFQCTVDESAAETVPGSSVIGNGLLIPFTIGA